MHFGLKWPIEAIKEADTVNAVHTHWVMDLYGLGHGAPRSPRLHMSTVTTLNISKTRYTAVIVCSMFLVKLHLDLVLKVLLVVGFFFYIKLVDKNQRNFH